MELRYKLATNDAFITDPPLATIEGIAFPFLRYCYIPSSLSALNYDSVLAQCFFLHPLHTCWELFFYPQNNPGVWWMIYNTMDDGVETPFVTVAFAPFLIQYSVLC